MPAQRMFLPLGLLGTNSEQTYYVQAPFKCIVTDAQVTAGNSDIGDADTVTVYDGANAVGQALFGSTIAAGAAATYTPNTTYKNNTFEAGDNIKVVVSALDAAGDRVFVNLVLDEMCIGQ